MRRKRSTSARSRRVGGRADLLEVAGVGEAGQEHRLGLATARVSGERRVAEPGAATDRHGISRRWQGRGLTPATISPSASAAIETHQCGRPRAKFVVPSIGSTYQTSRPPPCRPPSSPTMVAVRHLGADPGGDARLGGAVVHRDDVVGVALGRGGHRPSGRRRGASEPPRAPRPRRRAIRWLDWERDVIGPPHTPGEAAPERRPMFFTSRS